MRRLPHILLCLWALCMLIGCAGDGYTPALRTADSLMNDSPSVALAMLDSLKGEAQGWSKAQCMRYHLLTMKAQMLVSMYSEMLNENAEMLNNYNSFLIHASFWRYCSYIYRTFKLI